MTKKRIEIGVVTEDELLLFFDYLNSDLDDNQYALLITNKRGKTYTARMIDMDGEDWYILKLLFEDRYQRIKRESVRSFEVKKFSK